MKCIRFNVVLRSTKKVGETIPYRMHGFTCRSVYHEKSLTIYDLDQHLVITIELPEINQWKHPTRKHLNIKEQNITL